MCILQSDYSHYSLAGFLCDEDYFMAVALLSAERSKDPLLKLPDFQEVEISL